MQKQQIVSLMKQLHSGVAIDALAQQTGSDTTLAKALFATGDTRARKLCAKIAVPKELEEAIFDQWIEKLESPELVDLFCSEVLVHNRYALHHIIEWARSKRPLTQHAAFVMMAAYARNNPDAKNILFYPFMPLLQEGIAHTDPLISEAARQAAHAIGARNATLARRLKAEGILRG